MLCLPTKPHYRGCRLPAPSIRSGLPDPWTRSRREVLSVRAGWFTVANGEVGETIQPSSGYGCLRRPVAGDCRIPHALIATYFIALPVTSEYVRLAHVGQFTYRIADYSPVLLLFCIVSLAGVVLFAGAVWQDGGR